MMGQVYTLDCGCKGQSSREPHPIDDLLWCRLFLLPLQRSTMQAQCTSTRRPSSCSRTTQCFMQTGRLHTSKSRSMALLSVMPQRPSMQTQLTQRYSMVINIHDSVCIKHNTSACSCRMVLGSNSHAGAVPPWGRRVHPIPVPTGQKSAAVKQQDVCFESRGLAGSIQGRSGCRAAGTSHSQSVTHQQPPQENSSGCAVAKGPGSGSV